MPQPARDFSDSEHVHAPGDGETIDALPIINADPGTPAFDALALPALPARGS